MKRRSSMRVRHIVFSLAAVVTLAGVLAGCELLGIVSIDDRIVAFQNELNASTRSTIYENFHPTLTSDFTSLKNATLTLDTIIPPLGTGDAQYSLVVTDKADPSTGVFVTIDGGSLGWGPQYLKLVMETTGTADYRIVSLEIDPTPGNFLGPADIK
jgi:outer membrane lipoprotein-sorting protein